MDKMSVYIFLCLLWTLLQCYSVTGAPFQNIPTPFAVPLPHSHGSTTAPRNGFLFNPGSGPVPTICKTPIPILNRSLSCDQSSFQRLDLSDQMLKQVLDDEGGDYVEEYMASSDDEASQNFKNLINVNSEYQDVEFKAHPRDWSWDYTLTKKVLLSKLEETYREYYSPTTPQPHTGHYVPRTQLPKTGQNHVSSTTDTNTEQYDSPSRPLPNTEQYYSPSKPLPITRQYNIPSTPRPLVSSPMYIFPSTTDRGTRQTDISNGQEMSTGQTSVDDWNMKNLRQEKHEIQQIPQHILSSFHPARYVYSERKRYPRDANGATSQMEYCVNLTNPLNGYFHLCSTCAHTTTLPGDRFPRIINEVWCNTDRKGCMYVGVPGNKTAHGGCRQSVFHMTMLRKKPNSCMTVLKDGQRYITDEWESYAQPIRFGCECMIDKRSPFAKYVEP